MGSFLDALERSYSSAGGVGMCYCGGGGRGAVLGGLGLPRRCLAFGQDGMPLQRGLITRVVLQHRASSHATIVTGAEKTLGAISYKAERQ